MFDINKYNEKMTKSVDALKHHYAGLRTARANAGLLDSVFVNVYGSKMPINQLATVSAPEARMLIVSVWDKSNVQAVEKAILESNLGITPLSDGLTIKLPIPALTEERRKDMAKMAAKYLEDCKVSIRNIRKDANDEIKKLELNEDETRRQQDNVQKSTDKYIGLAEDDFKKKEKEILTV
jgi:ribosome recycling factor